MSLQFEIEVKPTYLHVTSSGEFSFAGAKDIMQEIFKAAALHGIQKAFLDVRSLEGGMSTMERYNLSEFIIQQRFEHKGTAAILIGVLGVEPLIDPRRFAEVVLRNRGQMFKASTELNEILEWLDIELYAT